MLPAKEGSYKVKYGDLSPFNPLDGIKKLPKDIRKARSAAYPNWESIIRTFNPNTIGNNTTPSFWLAMSIALSSFPPSALRDASDVLSYDDSRDQRFYSLDLKVLHGISKTRLCFQDLGNDARTVYLRSLIMQGVCIACDNGFTIKPIQEPTEEVDDDIGMGYGDSGYVMGTPAESTDEQTA